MVELASFSVNAWKGVTAVPGGSPVAPAPNVLVLVPNPPDPKPPVEAPPVLPKSEPPVVAAPNAGLFWVLLLPKRPPPPVLPPPKGEVVLFAVAPKEPPEPNPPVVLLFEDPKREPPVFAVVEPNAGLLAPKALLAVLDPKPVTR